MDIETTTVRDIFKQRNRAPSIRQVRAVEAYLDGNGRKSRAEALREAGYSEAVADHPDKVFKSQAVRDLMADKGLSEGDLINTLKKKVESDKEHIQMQALDMSFKLLGSYAPKKSEVKADHRVGIFSMADLRRKMKESGIEIIPRQRAPDQKQM